MWLFNRMSVILFCVRRAPVSSCNDVGEERAVVPRPQLSVEARLTTHTTHDAGSHSP